VNLKPKAAAERLDCSPAMVYSLIRQGKLDAFKLGGRRLRIPEEAIEAYIRENRCDWLNSVGSGLSIDQTESAIPYVLPTER
jgi:excisionase family DNA binding protein